MMYEVGESDRSQRYRGFGRLLEPGKYRMSRSSTSMGREYARDSSVSCARCRCKEVRRLPDGCNRRMASRSGGIAAAGYMISVLRT